MVRDTFRSRADLLFPGLQFFYEVFEDRALRGDWDPTTAEIYGNLAEKLFSKTTTGFLTGLHSTN